MTDIRIGYDGTPHPTAGVAVREQIKGVKKDLSDSNTQLSELIMEISNNVPETAPFNIMIEKATGFYDPDINFQGGGTRIKSIYSIDKINTQFKASRDGVAYCEILDKDMNTLKTVESDALCGVDVTFTFDNFITNQDVIWVRFYGEEGLLPRRSEISIVSPNMISKQSDNNYHIFKTSTKQWYLTSNAAFCIPFTIYGKISKRSITVGADDYYSTLKSAIDYVESYPNHGWDINIREGTYNIYNELGGDDYYSSINPSDGNMQGLKIPDNVRLKGVGIVNLFFDAPDSLATSRNVPNISVLEVTGLSNQFENLIIAGKNCRYIIHDETANTKPNQIRKYKNVKLHYNGCVSGTWESPVSFGCGFSSNSYFEFDNCEFLKFICHNNKNQMPSTLIFNNCIFNGGSYSISLNTVTETAGAGKCYAVFNSCVIDYMIRILENSDIWQIRGSGNNDFNYTIIGDYYNQTYYTLSDKTYKGVSNDNIVRFQPVTLRGPKVVRSYNKNDFIGISLNNANDGDVVFVVKKGYYNCYGFSPFGDSDLVSISQTGELVTDDTNPIAKAVTVDGINQLYIF